MKQLNNKEVEKKLRSIFENNFEVLKGESGHAIDSLLKEKAFQQVLYFWKKNKDLITHENTKQIKLSMPTLKSPIKQIPYNLEGQVNILQNEDETYIFELKTSDAEVILQNPRMYEDQLYTYAYILNKLHGKHIKHTDIVSTFIPEKLETALKINDKNAVAKEFREWNPFLPFEYKEEKVSEILNNFGIIVEHIEDSDISAPNVSKLLEKNNKTKKYVGSTMCVNCDFRYSCHSYAEFIKLTQKKSETNMFKYIKGKLINEDEYFLGNFLDDQNKDNVTL